MQEDEGAYVLAAVPDTPRDLANFLRDNNAEGIDTWGIVEGTRTVEDLHYEIAVQVGLTRCS